MTRQIEWVVIYAGGLPVDAWPNDRKDWCWGATTGSSGDLCGGCSYCLEMQARHADCDVKYVIAPENPEQSDLFGPPHLSFLQRYRDGLTIVVGVILILGGTLLAMVSPILITWWIK